MLQVPRRPGDRVSPSLARRSWLAFTVAIGALAGLAFGVLAHEVVAHSGAIRMDHRVTVWVATHRTDWLTPLAKVLTWLGSLAVIVPLGLIVCGALIARRRDWRAVVMVLATVAGSVVLYNVVKQLVGRPRPPESLWIGHYDGWAFPSGHATQAIAFFGVLAVVLSTAQSPGTRLMLWVGMALVTLIVGASRIYLGAHWATDVLGGYALGTTWLAVVVAVGLLVTPRYDEEP